MEQVVLYREIQYLRQKLITALIAISFLLPVIIVAVAYVAENKSGTPTVQSIDKQSELVASLIFTLALGIAVFLLFRYSNLKLEVRTDGFYYKYFPFHLSVHKILTNDVSKVYIRDFSPLGEYGGWGIRYGFAKRGKGYIVSGKTGLQFELKNGKKILFTTTDPRQMEAAVNRIFLHGNKI